MDGILIRALSKDDSIAELTALLHAAYAQLAAMGFNYTAVDQDEGVTLERIGGGDCFVAEENKRLIGTVLYHGHGGGTPWYDLPHVAVINQFGVLPEFQKCGVGRRLLAAAEACAKETGAGELALDTSEGAHQLIEWYARHGYRVVEHVQWGGKTYRSVIMSKTIV